MSKKDDKLAGNNGWPVFGPGSHNTGPDNFGGGGHGGHGGGGGGHLDRIRRKLGSLRPPQQNQPQPRPPRRP